MWIYFLLLRVAALFGHRKARKLVQGQAACLTELASQPVRQPGNVIWFHAASVGEFEQARPIIERLRQEHPTAEIVLTFFSPSGYELRKGYDKVDRVLYLPFATRRNAKAFIAAVQPQMAIFVKYEFWPAYLRQLKKLDIPTYSISAIFRPQQLFFKPWGRGYRRLLHCFTHIFVQDEASCVLLKEHGIAQVSVAGDTRFDRVTEIAKRAKEIPQVDRFVHAHEQMLLLEKRQIIIAGSTWPQDEALLAEYLRRRPNTMLVIAPHEIHEQHMHSIFQTFKGAYVRYTEATMNNLLHTRILVIDTIGMLSSIYRYGQVAYVGGGFGAGIHNTIEAAVYGMPVIFGPKYKHFREAKGLIAAGAGCSVKDYPSFESAMDEAFARQAEMGHKAAAYVQSELGATDTIYKKLF